LSLSVLLVVRVWIPPTFEGIDPEQRLSSRRLRELALEQGDSMHNDSGENGKELLKVGEVAGLNRL
jgi:hypothetical protein